MENINKTAIQDCDKINVNEVHELQYWKKELKLTAEELCQLVQKVGVRIDDVLNELNKQPWKA